MKEKGYILLGMLLMMLLMAVTAVALNRRAAVQARMATNQTLSIQTFHDQLAAVEEAVWHLTKDPCWRTSASGEAYSFNGKTYNRKVLSCPIAGYTDAITVSAKAPGAANSVRTSFRYYIDTVAGTGVEGYGGDGGQATSAELKKPQGIAVDASGNIYIADTQNHCIRKVDTSGIITCVAGVPGQNGYSGNDGLATNARLDVPQGVFVDVWGDIYIADTNNCWIRKVDALTGVITRVAGKLDGGAPKCGGDDQEDGSPANNVMLDQPHGVFVDASGNIYIADTNNCWIRKVDAFSGVITRIAGKSHDGDPLCGYSGDGMLATNAQLDKPGGVFVDGLGNIYIADTNNNRIRKVDAATGLISTIAGNGASGYSGDGGPAISAQLNQPEQVFVDSSGNIFIADTGNHVIRIVSVHDDNIYPMAGIGETAGYNGDDRPATTASLGMPSDVAMAAIRGGRKIYISDTDNDRIRVLTLKPVKEL